jgi:hypothetical protein
VSDAGAGDPASPDKGPPLASARPQPTLSSDGYELPPGQPPLSPEEIERRQRRHRVSQGTLWFMRIGIIAMLAVIAVLWWRRNHQDDNQLDLIRYVEIDLPALSYVEGPVVERLNALFEEKTRKPEEVRREIADELMPALIRLRKAAEAPKKGAQTDQVRALAGEYFTYVEALIEVGRTAIRVIDDKKLDPQEGFMQLRGSLRAAAEKNSAWRRHVSEASQRLGLSKPH